MRGLRSINYSCCLDYMLGDDFDYEEDDADDDHEFDEASIIHAA